MALTVKLANTNDNYYKVGKTITTVTTLSNVSIVYPCDILSPTIKIKGGYVSANYVTGLFGRKYWIMSQTINDGINYIKCAIDPWESFSDAIIGSTQFVTRSEKHGNVMLSDSAFPSTADTIIDMYPKANPQTLISNLTYVIGVI